MQLAFRPNLTAGAAPAGGHLLQPTMAGDLQRGVPTGLAELDEVTNGLQPGQMIVVAAKPGVGKALAIDTPLPTPSGWTTMRDVEVGDQLIGPDGQPTRVVAATTVMSGRPCYEVEFSDGTVIVADEDHQWPTHRGILTTAQLLPGTDRIAPPDSPVGRHGATAVMVRTFQIHTVRRIPTVPVRCVEVDNQSHVYLAGPGMVPTHNSNLGLDFLRSCSIKHRISSVIFSLELSRSEIVMRLLSAEAKVRLADMQAGRMSEDDWMRVARRISEISDAPLYIEDSLDLTMTMIQAKARRLHQKTDLRLIVVDSLQLIASGSNGESRRQDFSELSRQLKLLAKELHVPVVAMSQLNRGSEQRTDKKPMLSDLCKSGAIEHADMVIVGHRPHTIEHDDSHGREADRILGKHRAGPRTITVAHQLHLSLFTHMAH